VVAPRPGGEEHTYGSRAAAPDAGRRRGPVSPLLPSRQPLAPPLERRGGRGGSLDAVEPRTQTAHRDSAVSQELAAEPL